MFAYFEIAFILFPGTSISQEADPVCGELCSKGKGECLGEGGREGGGVVQPLA